MRILFLGKKGSGKSSLLATLFKNGDCGGIICPSVFEEGTLLGKDAINLITGERCVFCRIKERATFEGTETRNYIVSREGIEFCIQALEQAREKWLIIIDEVGPLELAGEGLYEITKEILESERNVVVVVREELEEEFLRAFPYEFKKMYVDEEK